MSTDTEFSRVVLADAAPATGKDMNHEKSYFSIWVSICLSLLLTPMAFAASSREDLQARVDAAKVVLDQIMGAGDERSPATFFSRPPAWPSFRAW